MGYSTMKLQIEKLLIFNHDGKKRSITFETGNLNIIIGSGSTGKSALIPLIEYCMGSNHYNAPKGEKLNLIEWVGVIFKIKGGNLFIARKIGPKRGATEDIYIDIQECIETKNYNDLKKNRNLESLKLLLSKILNINWEFKQVSPKFEEKAIKTNVKHAKYFNFLEQEELISKKVLFHNQTDYFEVKALKDNLPYFLGAPNEDYLKYKQKKKYLTKKLNNLMNTCNELELLKNNSQKLVNEIINEFDSSKALNDALITQSHEKNIEFLEDLYIKFAKDEFNEELDINLNYNKITELKIKKDQILDEIDEKCIKLDSIKNFLHEQNNYEGESKKQFFRLKSIDLFENSASEDCPFCNSKLNSQNNLLNILKSSMDQIEFQLRNYEEIKPEIHEQINLYEKDIEINKNSIKSIDKEIERIIYNNRDLKKMKDRSNQKSYLLGKLSFFIDSLKQHDYADYESTKKDIINTKKEISEISEIFNKKTIKKELDLINSKISSYISIFSNRFDYEHRYTPFIFDPDNLTIWADMDFKTPFKDIGSAENATIVHLIFFFALHKIFIENNSPVPDFLFIDQPSTAFFGTNDDKFEKSDNEKVLEIFEQINRFSKEMGSNLQIIVTDHAYYNECKDKVVEFWDREKETGLIPKSWLI